MTANETHKNDVGVTFLVTVKDDDDIEDVSGASTKEIIFQKPGGTNLTKIASFYTDGTDGKIYYVSIAGDLDEIGIWRMQAKVVIATGTYKTDIASFKVYDNLS